MTTITITVPGSDYVGEWNQVEGGWIRPAIGDIGFCFGESAVADVPVSLESIAAEAVRLSARANWGPVVVNDASVEMPYRVGMQNREVVLGHLRKLVAANPSA